MKFTKSATFLFPLLEIPKLLFKCEIKNRFGMVTCENRLMNVYLADEAVDVFKENHLFLLINNFRDVDFEDFEKLLISYPNYVDNYDQNGFGVYIFKIPEHNQIDYRNVLNGKYSKMTPESQALVRQNAYCNDAYHLLPLIFGKMAALRTYWEKELSNPGSEVIFTPEMEVWPIININKEILTQEILETISLKSKLIPSGEFE